MLLNFGHTLGHAIEKVTDYSRYTHGQAVSIGMFAAARMGENLGVTSPGTADILKSVLLDHYLPVSYDLDPKALIDAMKKDKKTYMSLNKQKKYPFQSQTPLY